MYFPRIRCLFLVVATCMSATSVAGIFSPQDPDRQENELAVAHESMFSTFSAHASTAVFLPGSTRRIHSNALAPYKAAARSVRNRGNVGEQMMDDFYVSEGWEKINGQTGNQGIDGLYVRRGANGEINRVQVVDSKVGSSQLQKTDHGWQLSVSWTRKKLVDCLNAARREYAKKPTPEGERLIRDYEQMIARIDAGKFPSARIFHVELQKNVNGTTELVMQNGKVEFSASGDGYVIKPSQKALRVDMQSPDAVLSKRMLARRNKWYSELESQLTKGKVPSWVAKRIVASLKAKISNNEITTSKEVNKHFRDNILRYRKTMNAIVGTTAVVGFGVAQGGLSLAHDWLVGDFTDGSIKKAVGVSLKASAAGAAIGVGHRVATVGVARYIARRQLAKSSSKAIQGIIARATAKGASNAAKKKLEQKVTKKAAELIPGVGKALGAGAGAAFGAFEVGSAVFKLQNGSISKQDAVVYGSIGGLNILGAAAVYFVSGPVGWVVGGVTLVAGGAYSIYREREQRRLADWEDSSRARHNAEKRRKRIEDKIGKLKSESLTDEELGWQSLRDFLVSQESVVQD